VGIRKHYGKERLLCRDTDNSEFYVPVEYTSEAQNGAGYVQAGADCDFRYEDLLALLEIIKDVNVKYIMSLCKSVYVARRHCA
jgi:hypothetical protein